MGGVVKDGMHYSDRCQFCNEFGEKAKPYLCSRCVAKMQELGYCRVRRDDVGSYIIPEWLVRNFKFWKGIAEYALNTEEAIERSYARTFGEEGEIALGKLAEELFGLEVDFTKKEVR